MERPTPIKDAAVHRLAQSITQLTLCQVTTSEVDDATKLLEKARQKLQSIQNIPSQRVNDLEAAIRQLRETQRTRSKNNTKNHTTTKQ